MPKRSKQIEIADPELLHWLRLSSVYELLALAYAYPRPDKLSEVREGATELSSNVSLVEELGIGAAAADLAAAAHGADAAELETTYNDLFSGGTPVPFCESSYTSDSSAVGKVLADIAGFYSAFGVGVSVEAGATIDAIGSELQFMSVLISRRIAAELRTLGEQADVCREAEEAFLREHLGTWVAAFARALDVGSESPYYLSLAPLTAAFVAAEARERGLSPIETAVQRPSD